MYIVMVGCGRMGSNIAKELANEGHDVVVIDKDEKNLENLGVIFNGQRIRGIEIDKDVLISAGINDADVFLAMTPDDNVNVMSSQIAKNIFGVKRVISRVCDPQKEYMYKQFGIEYLCPVGLSVSVIKNKLIMNENLNIAVLDNEMVVCEIPITDGRNFSIDNIESKYNCIISAVFRNGSFKLCNKEDLLQKGDKVVCTISIKDKNRLVSEFSKERLI